MTETEQTAYQLVDALVRAARVKGYTYKDGKFIKIDKRPRHKKIAQDNKAKRAARKWEKASKC